MRVRIMIRVLLSLCALAVFHHTIAAPAESGVKRCQHGATGDLVGHSIYLNRGKMLPISARQYDHHEPLMLGCVLNGASARACDLFPPEVDVTTSDGDVHIQVRRMGPRLQPVSLEVYLYCDPVAQGKQQLGPAITAV